MSERKDMPTVPTAKPANRAPLQLAATTPPRPPAPNPAAVRSGPPAVAGFGHAMIRPVPTQADAAGTAAAHPQPAPPKPAPAPVPVAAAKPAPAPVPVAAAKPAPAPVPVAAAKPAPSAAPARKAVPPAMPALPAWFKGFDVTPFWAGYGKFGALGNESMRATIEAGAILLRGVDRLTQEIVTLAGEQMASSAAAAEGLGACASFEALVAKQMSLAQANYGHLAAAADRLSQMSVALAEEVCEPFADEVDAAADRFIKTFAR
jgi:hypothetical protein